MQKMAPSLLPRCYARSAQLKNFSVLASSTTPARLCFSRCFDDARTFSTSSPVASDGEGFFSKLMVRKIDTGTASHSRLLSDKEYIYELVTHNVKPSKMDDYVASYGKFVELVKSKDNLSMELVGSWVVGIGDQDQCLHLWKHHGFEGVDDSARTMRTDQDCIALRKERTPFLRSRRNQYLLSFSYWPPIEARTGQNLYEIRSYTLKPGTMIEWGNNWARGIQYRTGADAPFAGFFSQIGVLYQVHHIWTYESLAKRKSTREASWRNPGWDKCVANTVPLIRHMETRIMAPTPFSPTK